MYVTVMTFSRCRIPIHSPGPCIIDRRCYNTTGCMRTEYQKPAWTKGLLRPDPIVLQQHAPAPDRYHPVRILFRPEVTRAEVKFAKKKIVSNIQPLRAIIDLRYIIAFC